MFFDERIIADALIDQSKQKTPTVRVPASHRLPGSNPQKCGYVRVGDNPTETWKSPLIWLGERIGLLATLENDLGGLLPTRRPIGTLPRHTLDNKVHRASSAWSAKAGAGT